MAFLGSFGFDCKHSAAIFYLQVLEFATVEKGGNYDVQLRVLQTFFRLNTWFELRNRFIGQRGQTEDCRIAICSTNVSRPRYSSGQAQPQLIVVMQLTTLFPLFLEIASSFLLAKKNRPAKARRHCDQSPIEMIYCFTIFCCATWPSKLTFTI